MGGAGHWALVLYRRKEDGDGAWALGAGRLGVGNEGRAQGQAIKGRVPTPTPTLPILSLYTAFALSFYMPLLCNCGI